MVFSPWFYKKSEWLACGVGENAIIYARFSLIHLFSFFFLFLVFLLFQVLSRHMFLRMVFFLLLVLVLVLCSLRSCLCMLRIACLLGSRRGLARLLLRMLVRVWLLHRGISYLLLLVKRTGLLLAMRFLHQLLIRL